MCPRAARAFHRLERMLRGSPPARSRLWDAASVPFPGRVLGFAVLARRSTDFAEQTVPFLPFAVGLSGADEWRWFERDHASAAAL